MDKLLRIITLALCLSGCSGADLHELSATGPTSFLLGVIPDTQFMSENNKRGFLNLDPRYPGLPFEPAEGYYAMTQWLADNAADYQVSFVIHVGDIIQSGAEQTRSQWEVADRAMATLEGAGVPYSVSTGNHDVRDQTQLDDQRNHRRERFLEYFSPTRAAERNARTFLERDPLGYSEAHLFTALEQPFLVITIDWRASDSTLDWVKQRIADHPQVPVILMSHDIIGVDGSTNTPVVSGNGERLWNEVIADNDQVFMTISGHHHYAARIRRSNHHGNSVDLILTDYQDEYAGGNGMLRLMELDLAAGAVEVLSFSPWALKKMTDPALQSLFVACPSPEVTDHCDQVLPEPNINTLGVYYDNQYRFDLDFRARFAGFDGYHAETGRNDTSLLDRLRTSVEAAVAAR